MDRFGAVGREAKRVYQEVRTPAEEYRDRVERLNELLKSGKLSQENFSRAMESARDKMREAQGQATTTAEAVDRIGEGFRRLIEVTAVIEIGRKLQEFVSSSIESVAATEHLAQSLGATTHEMQQLQYAAVLTDTSTEALSTGLGHLQKELGQLASGGGSKEAKEALSALHVTVQQLASESPTNALKDIAEGIKGIENPSQRTAAAMALFGRGGRELIPVLLEGRQGLEDLGRAADDTGYAMSEGGIASVKVAAESMHEASLAAQGLANRLAASLSPAIVAVAQEMGVMAREANEATGSMQAMQSDGLNPLALAAAYVAQSVQLAGLHVSGYLVAIGQAITYVAGSVTSVADFLSLGLIGPLDRANDAVHNFRNTLGYALDDIHKQIDDAENGHSIGDAFVADMEAAKKRIAEAAGKNETVGIAPPEIADGLGTTAKEADRVVGIIERLREKLDGTGRIGANSFEKLNHELLASHASIAQINQAFAILQQQAEKDVATKVGDVFKHLDESLRSSSGDATNEVEKLNHEILAAGGSVQDVSRAFRELEQIDAAKGARELAKVMESLGERASGLSKAHDILASGGKSSEAQEAIRNAKELDDLRKKLEADHSSPQDRNAALSTLASNQAMEHQNRLLEEGSRLRESLESPAEKMAEEQAHLMDLLKSGAITWETYQRAIDKANKSMKEARQQDAKEFGAGIDLSAFASLGDKVSAKGHAGHGGGSKPPANPPAKPPVGAPSDANLATNWSELIRLMRLIQPDIQAIKQLTPSITN